MDQKRIFLYVALVAILFALWQKWQLEHPAVVPTVGSSSAESNADLPPLSAQARAAHVQSVVQATPTAVTNHKPQAIISVETDVLRVGLDLQGGNLVRLHLLGYPQSLDSPDRPLALLDDTADTFQTAQSGLIGKDGPDNESGQAVYSAEKTSYQLEPGKDNLEVALFWHGSNGVRVQKIFTFTRGKYAIAVRYLIDNQSADNWSGQFYAQIKQRPMTDSGGFFGLHTFTGGAISSAETPYEKIAFSKFEKHDLEKASQGGWLAMQQRYFLSAWISDPTQQNHYYTRFDPARTLYTLGYVGPVINVPAGEQVAAAAKLYAGPEVADSLAKVAPHLDLTVDYGWLWPISVAIFAIMKYIHRVLGNWGWSIVLVTLLIKLLFYKLSATSYRSMAKMRKLTPHLRALKERYGDDRQKLSQATMELYKKQKVNPLSGCLPILIQIPFFVALYYVLIESVELRQAPFILWIHDLSIRDPYFILPILMGISMFLQQRLNPPPPDPVQAKVMMCLPIIFTLFFVTFPAGLVLYWLVNNCIGALQQWYIMKRIESQP